MAQAKDGDKVKIHYTGKLDDGTVFDSSEGREPLEFTLGDGKIIPGFEKGTLGMEVGERKTITVPPKKGFGAWSRNNIMTIKKSDIPENITPQMGQRLQIPMEGGKVAQVTVTKIGDSRIEVDGNHPLAGKTLTFEVELLGIL